MFHSLLYPRQVVLVVAASDGKANATTVAWITPVSEKPPMLSFALHNASLTLDLLCASMDFVVAIPGEKLKDAVLLCGTTTGKYIDKFEEAHLTQVKAKKVKSPLILEAEANIECRVVSYTNAGDHSIVVGEVVEVHAPEDEMVPGPIFSPGGKKLFAFKQE